MSLKGCWRMKFGGLSDRWGKSSGTEGMVGWFGSGYVGDDNPPGEGSEIDVAMEKGAVEVGAVDMGTMMVGTTLLEPLGRLR